MRRLLRRLHFSFTTAILMVCMVMGFLFALTGLLFLQIVGTVLFVVSLAMPIIWHCRPVTPKRKKPPFTKGR